MMKAKLVLALAGDERVQKTIARVLVAVLSPLILITARLS